MKTEILINALDQIALSLNHTCGSARIFEMGAMVTELLELQQTFTLLLEDLDLKDKNKLPEDYREMGIDVERIVHCATFNHAFLVCNRPSDTASDVQLVSDDLYLSQLEYRDASPSDTERAHYQQLAVTFPIIPALPDRIPFPLCELAVQLSIDIRAQANILAQRLQARLNAIQREFFTDQHDHDLQYYIDRTIEAGLMNQDGQWEPTVNRYQIAYWVDCAARRLNISSHWKWASQRWGLPCLASYQNRILMGTTVPGREVIDTIFE